MSMIWPPLLPNVCMGNGDDSLGSLLREKKTKRKEINIGKSHVTAQIQIRIYMCTLIYSENLKIMLEYY